MAKYLFTFLRKASFEVEVEAESEDLARQTFLDGKADGIEKLCEVCEDMIIKVEELVPPQATP